MAKCENTLHFSMAGIRDVQPKYTTVTRRNPTLLIALEPSLPACKYVSPRKMPTTKCSSSLRCDIVQNDTDYQMKVDYQLRYIWSKNISSSNLTGFLQEYMYLGHSLNDIRGHIDIQLAWIPSSKQNLIQSLWQQL